MKLLRLILIIKIIAIGLGFCCFWITGALATGPIELNFNDSQIINEAINPSVTKNSFYQCAELSHTVSAGLNGRTAYTISSNEFQNINLSYYNRLEFKIKGISDQEKVQWDLQIKSNDGDEQVLASSEPNGSTGSFGWNLDGGVRSVKIIMTVQCKDGERIVGEKHDVFFEYIRFVHQPDGMACYYWKEDFLDNIQPLTNVAKWWDYHDVEGEEKINAEIVYADNGGAIIRHKAAFENATDPDTCYVNAPGTDVDIEKNPVLKVVIKDLKNSDLKLVVYPLKDKTLQSWEYVVIDILKQPGTYTYHLLDRYKKYDDALESLKDDSLHVIRFVVQPGTTLNPSEVTIEEISVGNSTLDHYDPTTIPTAKIIAFPNPFNPIRVDSVEFRFDTAYNNTSGKIEIFNLKGRLIRTLVQQRFWDGRNSKGNLCENGVYIVQMTLSDKIHSGHVVLIK